VVSVGGGATGAPLLKAAAAARPLTALADRTWRLLVGEDLPPAERASLGAGEGIVIEPARADFTTLLRNATLSISQAGYNTTIETLCCAERAVLVPFGTARETEQADRAHLLAERGMVAVVSPGTLTPESLAAATRRALAGPSLRSFPPCDANGGPATASLLHRLLAK
jgi:predicted glycosyltransferase